MITFWGTIEKLKDFSSSISLLINKWLKSGEKIIEHDKMLFDKADAIMTEKCLNELLEYIGTFHSYTVEMVSPLDRFYKFFDEEGNQFINIKLKNSSLDLAKELRKLVSFLAAHFFVYPNNQPYDADLRLCLYPELNIDRGGHGTPEEREKYDKYETQMFSLLDTVKERYVMYRRLIKKILLM